MKSLNNPANANVPMSFHSERRRNKSIKEGSSSVHKCYDGNKQHPMKGKSYQRQHSIVAPNCCLKNEKNPAWRTALLGIRTAIAKVQKVRKEHGIVETERKTAWPGR